jgi:hypothetical protein
MRKILIVFIVFAIFLFASCVSLQDKEMNRYERESEHVVGTVTVEFTTFQFFHISNKNGIKYKANNELLRAAQKEYGANVDIRNIVISGNVSGWELAYIIGGTFIIGGIPALIGEGDPFLAPTATFVGLNLIGNFQKIIATGDVISTVNTVSAEIIVRRTSNIQSGIEVAMNNGAEVLMSSLQRNFKLAIVNVSSIDMELSEFVAHELEYILVTNNFTVVDRSELDRIRREQNFQLSGEVDDNTIVSIGRFAGADVVITGAVTGSGETRRLRLRALNTQTAQVMAVASERF